jgi:hypothetical protein
MSALRRQLLDRLPAIAGFLVIAVIFLTGVLHRHTVRAGWEQVRVPMGANGPWEDAGTVTYNIDCKQKGIDPYSVPCAPGDRNYNYPPIWLDLGYLGVHGTSAPGMGWIFLIFTVSVYVFVLRARSVFSAVCVFIAITFSSSLTLALERGNTDQAILFLLCFAFLIASRLPQPRGNLLRGVTVVFLTALKIYPVAAAISLLRGRGLWATLGWGAAAVAFLVVTCGSDLAKVFHETPTLLYATFGIIPTAYAAGTLVHQDLSLWVMSHRAAEFGISAALFVCFAALGAAFPRKAEAFLPAIQGDRFQDSLAIACVGIYCFAFSGGASFNYRLIFLVPVLALLLQAFERGQRNAALLSILITTYLVVPYPHGRLRAAMDLLVFLSFSIWLGTFAKRELSKEPVPEPHPRQVLTEAA